MEIKDLEIFMKVYEYQNMTKAAQELFLSPQSVSNTILKLENEFNVILFERTTSGSLPTQEAIMLRANAMKLLNDFETVRGTFLVSTRKRKLSKSLLLQEYFVILPWTFSISSMKNILLSD